MSRKRLDRVLKSAEAIKRFILREPYDQTYYALRSDFANGEIVLSPVMNHENYMIYEEGLRSGVMRGEIKNFYTLARGDEDMVTDLLYKHAKMLNREI